MPALIFATAFAAETGAIQTGTIGIGATETGAIGTGTMETGSIKTGTIMARLR